MIAAETANIVALKEAGIGDQAIVQWTLKDEYKHIAEADAKKFEHIRTGNVTVVGGPSDAANFLLKTADTIQKFSSLSHMIPGMDGILGKLKKFDEDNRDVKTNDPKELNNGFDETK